MYIAIEGVKGSGKSTVISAISSQLLSQGVRLHLVAPTRKSNNFSAIEFISDIIPLLRKCDKWNEKLYAHRSRLEAKKFSGLKGLFLGDRSIVTSYVTRWNKWLNHNECIERVNNMEPELPAPDHIIYLNVSENVVLNRLHIRTNRTYGKQDESPERVKEALDSYNEIRNYNIKRLEKSQWHDLDANVSPKEVLEQSIYTIHNIIGIKIN